MKPRVFLPAVASGVLLWAAFFPLDLGPLAFVALAPWLTLVRAPVTRRRRYLAAYVGGFAFFLPALQWLRVAHPMMHLSWLGLALVCPLFWVVGLALLRRLDRVPGLPLAASVPAVWVGLEYVRAHFPTGFDFLAHVGLHQKAGFGWYFLGYTQHAFLPLVQAADLGGVYAVSVVVAAVNGLAAEWFVRPAAVRAALGWGDAAVKRPRLVPATAGTAAVFAAAVGYGLVRLNHPEFAPGPLVAAIQGSVPQADKHPGGDSLGKTYFTLHTQAARATPRPDLVVWPETCCPVDWLAVAPGLTPPADVRARTDQSVQSFAGFPWGVPVLLGLNGLEWEPAAVWRYNSALLLSGGLEVGRYDKIHLVPFGEYVPFRETFPWLQAFTPYSDDYSCRPGGRWTRFPLAAADGRRFTFSCLICYEDSDPSLARRYAVPSAAGEAPVDFQVNISNDGWFDGTEEHEQHLAICRFRAVECRRSVVRAVNMGISAVIDPDGRVVALPGPSWSASKKVEGVVTAVVPLDDRTSAYARLGDWVPGACWAVVLLGVLFGRRRESAGAV